MYACRQHVTVSRLLFFAFLFCCAAPQMASAEHPDGESIFKLRCARCHDSGAGAAPPRIVLASMSSAAVYLALSTGQMKTQGGPMSDEDRLQVAEYITGGKVIKRLSNALRSCDVKENWFDPGKPSVGVGWGVDRTNSRLIPAHLAGLGAADVPNLRFRWAFSYPDAERAPAQPLVAAGALFVGSQNGVFYALDSHTGCVHWTFKATAEMRGAPVIRLDTTGRLRPTVYFGDLAANVYALDARTGEVVWKLKVDQHQAARIVGSVILLDNRLYVPVTAVDEISAGPGYKCCTGRGSIVALNANTGEVLWKRYTIPKPAVEQRRTSAGQVVLGPSGAGVWSTPVVDTARNLLYFGTGNNYSDPGDGNSDAIFALDLRNGSVRWRKQTLAGDVWNGWTAFCGTSAAASNRQCKGLRTEGPDIDFAAAPVLVRAPHDRDILVAGRKDGTVFGIAPDTGEILWTTRTTTNKDPYSAELYFGMMAEGNVVIVPSTGAQGPYLGGTAQTLDSGIHALDAFTGKLLWSSRVSENCPKKEGCLGIGSAPIGFPGIAFAGSMDGYIRAYSTRSGKVLWRYDTTREVDALNGDRVNGGAVVGNGIMVADGMLYVNSGYRERSGNVLLAFGVEKPTSVQTAEAR
jgi:polyvinyl alcohol dehydrogenase (cytochrome)